MSTNTSTAVAGPLTLLYAADVARWYEDMAPQITRWLARRGVTSAREAEDITQEAFVRVMGRAAQLAAIDGAQRRRQVFQLAAWAHDDYMRVLLHQNHKHAPRAADGKHLSPLQLDAFPDPDNLTLATPADTDAQWLTHASPDAQPEQSTAARMTLRALWDATPHEYRTLLAMTLRDVSREEIAAALGTSVHAVDQRLARLRAYLRTVREKIA